MKLKCDHLYLKLYLTQSVATSPVTILSRAASNYFSGGLKARENDLRQLKFYKHIHSHVRLLKSCYIKSTVFSCSVPGSSCSLMSFMVEILLICTQRREEEERRKAEEEVRRLKEERAQQIYMNLKEVQKQGKGQDKDEKAWQDSCKRCIHDVRE